MKNHMKLFDCYSLSPFIFLVSWSRDSEVMIIRQSEETKSNVNKQEVLGKFVFCVVLYISTDFVLMRSITL